MADKKPQNEEGALDGAKKAAVEMGASVAAAGVQKGATKLAEKGIKGIVTKVAGAGVAKAIPGVGLVETGVSVTDSAARLMESSGRALDKDVPEEERKKAGRVMLESGYLSAFTAGGGIAGGVVGFMSAGAGAIPGAAAGAQYGNLIGSFVSEPLSEVLMPIYDPLLTVAPEVLAVIDPLRWVGINRLKMQADVFGTFASVTGAANNIMNIGSYMGAGSALLEGNVGAALKSFTGNHVGLVDKMIEKLNPNDATSKGNELNLSDLFSNTAKSFTPMSKMHDNETSLKQSTKSSQNTAKPSEERSPSTLKKN